MSTTLIKSNLQEILTMYQGLQHNIPIVNEPAFSELVNSSKSNRDIPVHNWYRFKEGYSPELLDTCLRRLDLPDQNLRILDPFAGSGTTQVYAQFANRLGHRFAVADGIEVNPFIHFISSVKTKWHEFDAESLSCDLQALSLQKNKLFETLDDSMIPEVSTISELRAFSKSTLTQLINLKSIIRDIVSETNQKFYYLVYASILEPLSTMRKDGRALRIVREASDHQVWEAFASRSDELLNTIRELAQQSFNVPLTRVVNSDIRMVKLPKSFYDVAFFSPPYLNNFDYTEVYKLEAWMLGFYSNREEFRQQRYKTLRSHLSVKFESTDILERFPGAHDLKSIIKVIEKNWGPLNSGRVVETVKGYIDDMLLTLLKIKEGLRRGGYAICVVANSCFGDASGQHLVIATDLIISEMARLVGLSVEEIIVARNVTSRRSFTDPLLRESIIIMRTTEQ